MKSSNLRLFRNKKVFITGHTGFKGSWLSLWLSLQGAELKGYSLKPEKNSLYNKIESGLKINSVIADIRNSKRLKKEILNFEPDIIFHLAAQPLVRKSYRVPLETFETNITGTANLLDALKFLKKKCIAVIVTTDKVYKNLEKNYAYREADMLGGYDPYSASKAASEIIVDSYRLSFFHPDNYREHKKAIASARAGNVIGGGDFAEDRIVPDIIRALKKNKPLQVRNPNAIRPWQHVLEPLSGYLSLAAHLYENPEKFGTAFNFGPKQKDVLTVEELIKQAISCWGSGKYEIYKQKNQPHEAGLLSLNISKAKAFLDWEPKWDSRTAIDNTISWYKKSLQKNSNVLKLCVEEIEQFLK